MTEAEWLSCEKVVVPVMNWLRRHGTGRQFYLAGCAAVRHIFPALPDERLKNLVTLVERHADGELSAGEIRRRQHHDDRGMSIDRPHDADSFVGFDQKLDVRDVGASDPQEDLGDVGH